MEASRANRIIKLTDWQNGCMVKV